jgi:hypothetical protein
MLRYGNIDRNVWEQSNIVGAAKRSFARETGKVLPTLVVVA